MSAQTIFSGLVCLTLFGLGAWVRIPARILAAYLGAVLLMGLSWGLSFERSYRRAVGSASLWVAGATVVAFIAMLLPNEELARRCREPGMHCEDFSGAVLIYGAPFFLLGVALLAAAVHAATLGLRSLTSAAAPRPPSSPAARG